MPTQDEIERALQELREQQTRLIQLRADRDKITRSRFYALSQLWTWAKRLAGVGIPDDRSQQSLAQAVEQVECSIDTVAAAWRSFSAHRHTDMTPVVSVIIPVFNHLDSTLGCLHSIAKASRSDRNAEYIVFDDASTDATPNLLPSVPGVTYLRGDINRGFIASCNAAVARASAPYLLFLNNDTLVQDGWLDALVSTVESNPAVGAVGAKLLYPNGTLQEAGGIIWSDGSGWNYGRHGDPKDSRYNFRRDVDYCSGAALLVRADLFASLGGFSTDFAPAYYEDADLCFAIRKRGYRVVYEPRSEVVHVEGVSSGTDLRAGVKKHQEANRHTFFKKWSAELLMHAKFDASNVAAAARRLMPKPRVLIVDSYVPLYDKEAGSNRLMHVVRLLRQSGFGIIFLPDNYAALEPYTSELQSMGVEVLHHSEGGRPAAAALEEVLPLVDCAWISRPELFTKYADKIRAIRHVPLIYDTVDLHFLRKQREHAVLGGDRQEALRYERIEMSAAQSADGTIVVSAEEAEVLRQRGIRNVHVVPTIHDLQIRHPRSFTESSGLVFIGNYNHAPNVDAATHLVKEIMPVVWADAPDLTVTLLGSDPSSTVRALAGPRVKVTGFVRDVAPYFLKARIFVAPLRFGAGMKGKIGQALSYGLPVVATHVAAEGFGLTHGVSALIADDERSFARAISSLNGDPELWHTLSREAANVLLPVGSEAVKERLSEVFSSLLPTTRSQP